MSVLPIRRGTPVRKRPENKGGLVSGGDPPVLKKGESVGGKGWGKRYLRVRAEEITGERSTSKRSEFRLVSLWDRQGKRDSLGEKLGPSGG